jgi:hypothetical protein
MSCTLSHDNPVMHSYSYTKACHHTNKGKAAFVYCELHCNLPRTVKLKASSSHVLSNSIISDISSNTIS